MAVSVSYPGVYVQEIASGVRTIVGVGTAIGMFVGRTRMGELNNPVQCLSYEDFLRSFSAEYRVGRDSCEKQPQGGRANTAWRE